ncbi:MAG: hypothetical protein HY803_03595, partial [candidate division NC10 bacterium]|nr:hypothetical protein [candidate division NC10 bacterium]
MTEASREQQFFERARIRGLRPVGNTFADGTLRQISAFLADSLFREETARRPGVLQRVDPRARLLSTLLFLVSVSLARSIPSLLAHAALPFLAIALSWIRPREFLGAGFLLALTFSALIAAPAVLNVFVDGQVILPLLSREQEWR